MEPEKTDKKAWIYQLEEESWQAELLVSGAAIFGCLLLPDLISKVEDFVLYTVNREGIMLWYIIILFANMLAYTLILTFVIHFVMRALWIGIIGFNSAYPEGYKPNERFSKHFQEKLIEEYGNIYGYIKQLDNSCSTIFGMGFSVALVALGYVLLMTALGIIFFLIRDFVSDEMAWIVLGFILVLVFGFSIFSGILSSKKFRDTTFAKKYHYPMTKIFGRIVMNVGHRPAGYVMNVFTSQIADSSFGLWKYLGASLLVGVLGGLLGVSNMQVRTFIDQTYHRNGGYPSTIQSDFYAENEKEGYVYHPVIPKYNMEEGELFTAFLPMPNREQYELDDNCDLPEANQDRTTEGAYARQTRKVNCARQYYQFYLNGNEILDYELDRYWYGEQEQYGFLFTLFNLPAKPGKNEFRVESKYLDSDGNPRIARIPFYYSLE